MARFSNIFLAAKSLPYGRGSEARDPYRAGSRSLQCGAGFILRGASAPLREKWFHTKRNGAEAPRRMNSAPQSILVQNVHGVNPNSTRGPNHWVTSGVRRLLSLCLVSIAALGQSNTLTKGPHRMEITLERLQRENWSVIAPGQVLNSNDHVRFRFKTNFSGYLYVMNLGTSGDYSRLFPGVDTGEQNRIEAEKEYLIPATQGSFRITGPPGQDVLTWMVTPIALTDGGKKYKPLPPPPKPGKLSPSLVPRCDDTIFKSRGDCIDTSAGAKPVNPASRELVFMLQGKKSVVSSPVPLKEPVIYEFRLAHK